jgi:hypothetical protein
VLVRGDLKETQPDNESCACAARKIVNVADTDNTLYAQPEGPGLEAIAEGFRPWATKTTTH